MSYVERFVAAVPTANRERYIEHARAALPVFKEHGALKLVRRVEEEAQVHGHGHFYLYTPDQQALYRRLGWYDLEDREYSGEAVTIMHRSFTAPRA